MVVARDGEHAAHLVKKALVGTSASDLGASVAEALIERGALELLSETQVETA
jgi:hypothetical protein